MLKYLKELSVGETVIYLGHEINHPTNHSGQRGSTGDSNIVWRVVAKDHYAPNTVTLWADKPIRDELQFNNTLTEPTYQTWRGCSLQKRCEELYDSFPGAFKDKIIPVSLLSDDVFGPPELVSVFSIDELFPHETLVSRFQGTNTPYTIDRGQYISSLGTQVSRYDYFAGSSLPYWTRTAQYFGDFPSPTSRAYVVHSLETQGLGDRMQSSIFNFRPFITVNGDEMITRNTYFGHFVMYATSEEDVFGYINVNGEQKPLFGTKSFKEMRT
ncbi:hypothetical protein [Alkalihalobacterium chitinilyticum]|uniref:Uncharacterized protein n=1 Tax=Alkalihalobacterium chitinilyticum TaxID=2980103 RepID=A0ABT5VJ42_9BACI|nr:hypothetical protein [Alkalihalobacterium chitinilyticum]MDE5415477.1 hypothetical protein [Alkalihalobacterium chitinilyticum]